MEEDIVQEHNGWYFYMRDRSCRIGPYRDKKQFMVDYMRYRETGRISTDPTGEIGSCCSECEPD